MPVDIRCESSWVMGSSDYGVLESSPSLPIFQHCIISSPYRRNSSITPSTRQKSSFTNVVGRLSIYEYLIFGAHKSFRSHQSRNRGSLEWLSIVRDAIHRSFLRDARSGEDYQDQHFHNLTVILHRVLGIDLPLCLHARSPLKMNVF